MPIEKKVSYSKLSWFPAIMAVGAVSIFANRLSPPSNTPTPVVFVDVVRPAGITFRHDNAATSEKYLIETMASGCGWIDYNQDGLMDLYLVNGAETRLYKPPRALRSAHS